MKALKIILAVLVLISFQAHAEDDRTARNTANEAFEQAKKAAEEGGALAQYNLGLHYFDGRGVVKDYVEAVKWYRKAAEQGNANGQFMLGYMYESGKGVTKDEVAAVKWYQKASAQGNADAIRRLENVNTKSNLQRNGMVLGSIDAGIYTYIELTENGKTIWIAAPTIKVKKGDIIRFGEGAIMSNYFSKNLNRTFESVIFVDKAVVAN